MELETNKEPMGENSESAARPHHRHLEQEHIPASEHEFPSFGHASTDFVTRNHNRTTHRMIDHEPGAF